MIFFKIIVSLAIFCITTYIGIEKARSLKEREEILKDVITFLKLVQSEMIYMANLLPNAYERSRQKLNSVFKDVIGTIVVDMLKVESSEMSFSIKKNISLLNSLQDYDKEVVISILMNLGRGDIDSQNNIIENGITLIKAQMKEANEIKLKNSKLYQTIGAITGLLIVIIFI